MPASKKQMDKIAEYQKANNEQILIKPRREDRISERIQVLIDAKECPMRRTDPGLFRAGGFVFSGKTLDQRNSRRRKIFPLTKRRTSNTM